MSKRKGEFFHNEIVRQCRAIVVQGRLLMSAIEHLSDPAAMERAAEARDQVWSHIQAMLIAAANLSKMFDPPQGKRKPRADALQNHYQVPIQALLSRRVRDHFEHFDERIDKYADDSWSADLCIGRKQIMVRMVDEEGEPTGEPPPLRFFRHYDHTTGVVSFDEDEANLRDLFQLALALMQAAHDQGPAPTLP